MCATKETELQRNSRVIVYPDLYKYLAFVFFSETLQDTSNKIEEFEIDFCRIKSDNLECAGQLNI